MRCSFALTAVLLALPESLPMTATTFPSFHPVITAQGLRQMRWDDGVAGSRKEWFGDSKGCGEAERGAAIGIIIFAK